jgi:hypothetical protein
MPLGEASPPPVIAIATVLSPGALVNAGANGGGEAASAYKLAIFAAGLCAMLIAAAAVSPGCVPVVPPANAFVSSVEQALDNAPVEFTQAASTFPSVLISVCGTAPFPTGVVARAAPVESPTRFAAFANAFAIPVNASAVPELDT